METNPHTGIMTECVALLSLCYDFTLSLENTWRMGSGKGPLDDPGHRKAGGTMEKTIRKGTEGQQTRRKMADKTQLRTTGQ